MTKVGHRSQWTVGSLDTQQHTREGCEKSETLGRQRQAEPHELQAGLIYTVCPRPARAMFLKRKIWIGAQVEDIQAKFPLQMVDKRSYCKQTWNRGGENVRIDEH